VMPGEVNVPTRERLSYGWQVVSRTGASRQRMPDPAESPIPRMP
jgi:hypothetical protein